MGQISRRDLLSSAGKGVLGATLLTSLKPTPASGTLVTSERERLKSLIREQIPTSTPATAERDRGPFAFLGAPYRAKVSPPLADGKPLLVRGQIWAYDTKKPISNAKLEVWHADSEGRYSMDKRGDFRARLLADEAGYYEFETIHPFQYKLGANRWRSPHIHFMIAAPGYMSLVTQLFFQGDPLQDQDFLFREELAMPIEKVKIGNENLEVVQFDIVLEKGNGIKELRFGEFI